MNDPVDPPVAQTDVVVWKVTVCKIMEGGGTVNFSASATSGSLAFSNFSITAFADPNANPPACKVVWTGLPGTAVTFSVTEALSPSYELERILVRGITTGHVGLTVNGSTVTINEDYFASDDVLGDVFITYKNNPLTPPPGLSASKTAAGSYEIPVRWELAKSVTPTSHSGTLGQVAGSSTWTVTATKILGAATNHRVTGNITVSNPANGISRTFTVTDVVGGVAATVVCPSNTVAPGASVVCSYSAAVAGATLNTATVSSPGLPDLNPTAAVSYTSSFTGDQSVTLADPRFSHSEVISSSTTRTFPETFPCPSDASLYTNGTNTRTEVNTATLTGANTNLSRNASVVITCTLPPQQGETASGAGFPWDATQGAPNNWFMYTPWATTGAYRGISAAAGGGQAAGTNLIAGQFYVAGRITGTRGTTTSITITLNADWDFFGVADNVKIHPMSCTTAQPYVQPGKFTYKATAAIGASSITVSGLPNTACYGIHASVARH